MKERIGNGPISKAFKDRGIETFGEACALVKSLVYKRCSSDLDILKVLHENCGTCSSKHELIKRLADENTISNCQLILCVFKMSAANTRKVSTILERYGMEYIPEAHTYILYNGELYDLTFPGETNLNYLKDVIFSQEIDADHIREKADTHKSYLLKWIKEEKLKFSISELWEIREQCILALSE